MSIEIHDVSKRFGDFQALKDIHLHVETGQLVSLLGPSGCGKTTLLRIIAGLEFADKGQVRLDGQDVTALSVQQRKVAFMFQHYALFRHMTVFDNVAFGLTVLPRRERPNKATIKKTIQELLELVQLPHLASAFPAQLSGGQRQRIALARALAVKPKLLLLDEPFGALDAKVRKELRLWLRQIHHDLGITSLLVTHDQEEALEISDRIVLMNHGHIEQEGQSATLYHQPQTPFATEFLGEAQAFEGQVQDGRWQYGAYRPPLELVHMPQPLHNGAAITYVRPHQWQVERRVSPSSARAGELGFTRDDVGTFEPGELAPKTQEASSMIKGVLNSVQDLGDKVRLEVLSQTGLLVNVLISPQGQQHADYQVGETLALRPQRLTVFN